MMSNYKKRVSAVVAAALTVAVVLTGTFAWQSVSQMAKNEITGESNPGGRLHDDFNGQNKDVYVENFTDPDDDGVAIYARVRLDEYMEVGTGAGLKTGSADYDAKQAASLVAGADINDVKTWTTHVPAGTVGNCTNDFHLYWNWDMGGQTVFMPTFDKNKDSLAADINGTYDGTDAADDVHYDDYVAYADGDQKTGNAVYDADDNSVDEGDAAVEGTNIATVEETHTAKATQTATVITMAEWKAAGSQPGAYWVYDVDGWAYWAQAIQPGEATGLLLDGVNLKRDPGEDWYYAINVVAQFATSGDWGEKNGTGFYDLTQGSAPTDDGLYLLNKAADLLPAVTGVYLQEGTVASAAACKPLTLHPTVTLRNATGDGAETNVRWSIEPETEAFSEGTFTPTEEMRGQTYTITATSTYDTSYSASIDIYVYTVNEEIASITAGSTTTVTIDDIEFYVLVKEEDRALIWSKNPVVERVFGSSTVWRDSPLRTYFNGDWLESTTVLKEKAVETDITTRSAYNASTWITTTDKVFLLSEADVSGTFNSATTTDSRDYTYGSSVIVPDVNMRKSSNHTYMRSPTYTTNWLAVLNGTTGAMSRGTCGYVYPSRPAMWVDYVS